MSYPTFTDTMADIVYELDDREIYNDIRSQTELTTTSTDTVIDQPAVYKTREIRYGVHGPPAGGSAITTVSAHSGDAQVSGWHIESISGEYYDGTQYIKIPEITAYITSPSYSQSCTIQIVNSSSHNAYDSGGYVAYTYLAVSQQTHDNPTTNQVTYVVNSVNTASIAKYGRRTMNLTWPLGQTQDQMQALVDSYCARYCEPVSRVTMTVIGKTDALIVYLLSLKISDRITVINTISGLSVDFFINTIQYEHDVQSLPQATYTLEEIRGSEFLILFTLDTSFLDSESVLAY